MERQTAEQILDPMAKNFSEILTEKVTEMVRGYPDSTPTMRAAIALLVSENLTDWAEGEVSEIEND